MRGFKVCIIIVPYVVPALTDITTEGNKSGSYPSFHAEINPRQKVAIMMEHFSEDQQMEKDYNTTSMTKKHGRQLVWRPGDPQIAWYMSYPESGAPEFLHLIHLSTGRSTATNFGMKTMRRDGTFYTSVNDSVEVFDGGPVFYAPYLIKRMRYVATRTHGTGFCFVCHPKEYYYVNFDHISGSGSKLKNGKRLPIQYSATIVKKMIHLIRDPFDTTVARFFSYVDGINAGVFEAKTRREYTKDPSGFRQWCADQDELYEAVELARLPLKLRAIAKEVPCRQEFMKYARFHTNVSEMAKRMSIETIRISYDNYYQDCPATMKRVNDFLELSTLPNFEEPKPRYHPGLWMFLDYYTMEERRSVERILKNLIVPSLWWSFMSPYMVDTVMKKYSSFFNLT